MQGEDCFINLRIGNIQKEWYWIKPELEELLKDAVDPLYRPEDVYAKCLYGESTLILVDKGFLVITITEDELLDRKTFFIWIAKNPKNCNSIFELNAIMQNLEKLALQSNCSAMETRTPYKKVGSYLEKNGWVLSTLEYRKNLINENSKS